MQRVKVTNEGKRNRVRIGHNFQAGKTVELDVTPRDYLVLRSVRGLTVEKKQKSEAEVQKEAEEEFQKANVENALDMVQSGELDVDTALDLEQSGKNRSTLVEKLRSMQETEDSE